MVEESQSSTTATQALSLFDVLRKSGVGVHDVAEELPSVAPPPVRPPPSQERPSMCSPEDGMLALLRKCGVSVTDSAEDTSPSAVEPQVLSSADPFSGELSSTDPEANATAIAAQEALLSSVLSKLS
eukprot:RCo036147